jgi:GNAT superfamily N-acetyltransferase
MAQLQAALAAKLLFVAVEDDQLRGFAACRVIDRYLHLDELSVHPAYGRRGIGQALVSCVLAEASQRQLVGVSLTTFADLPWNAPFYQRLGFDCLAPDKLPLHLHQQLTEEQALGLNHRVAMLYTPTSP